MKQLKWLVFIILFHSPPSQAVEVFLYGGSMLHSTLGGCCTSSGGKTGGGVLARFDVRSVGELDIAGYSDGRWSEGSVLYPVYLLGGVRQVDAGNGSSSITVQTVADWRLITSVGGGYFSHTTRTTTFDLPTLVTGLFITDLNQIMYSWDDHLSFGAILQLTFAMSQSDQSWLMGTFLTVAYNF